MFMRPTLIIRYALSFSTLLFLFSSAPAQETAPGQPAETEVSRTTSAPAPPTIENLVPMPTNVHFMGVRIGMGADEVRNKLGHLKNKSKRQDFFVFSDTQSAQIAYDEQAKVSVISFDYLGGDNAPTPEAVLGEPVQAKPDGSMYKLKRYPAAGYWVAYSRTPGDKPVVTVTMQRIQ